METDSTVYDAIVVGAGIEGSSTAYYLAKSGKQTLLLEQFPLPHSRGSSHGQSRITRKAYGSREFYTQMMDEAFALTADLEVECGEQLFVNCGCLVISPKSENYVTYTKKCLESYGIPHDHFNVQEQRKRYPELSFSDNFEFVLDKSGGLLRADKMLKAFQVLFCKYGGVLRDKESMIELEPGNVVLVKTSKTVYKGRSVVLTLGPWAAKFLPYLGIQIPLQPLMITVCYWKDRNGNNFDISNFPVFTMDGAAGEHHIYGLPVDEYPGLVKICLHHGPNIDPDRRDSVENGWVLDVMRKVIATHFPSLEREPSVVESCIYTNTPDTNFVLDAHPKWKNVVIGAGFSGHGFKLSPVVGKVLAELAMGQTPSYDLSPFRIDRFFKTRL